MLEVLSTIFGALILPLSLKMFFTRWDCTDWFGKCLGTVGLAGITAAVCYFGVVLNNYLYFGFAGMVVAVFIVSGLVMIKRLVLRILRFFNGRKEEEEASND